MTYLLDWATTGTEVLVAVSDPSDATKGRHLVPGRVERDWQDRPVMLFTLPCCGLPQTVDATRLASTSAALHIADNGEGWALTVFAEGSEAHLRWLIRETQRDIRQLLGDRVIGIPRASRKLCELADTLNTLVCRATLMAEPVFNQVKAAA